MGLGNGRDVDLKKLIQLLENTSQPANPTQDRINSLMQRLIKLDKPATANYLDYQRLLMLSKLIKEELLTLDHNDSQKKMKDFISEKRAQLSAQTDVIALFHSRCIEGDIDFIQHMFPLIKDDIDVIHLFEHLIVAIRKNETTVVAKQIEVANYFYQNSEVARHYMLFLASKIYLVDSIGLNLLMEAFCSDNFELFQFLLQTSFTPTKIACLDYTNGYTLNMTQALIVFFSQNPKVKYMALLCQYKPNMEETSGILPKLDFGYTRRTPAQTLGTLNPVFNSLDTNNIASKKAAALGYDVVRPGTLDPVVVRTLSLEEIRAMCTGDKNMLQMAMSSHAGTSSELIRLLAEHCEMRTLLTEFTNTIHSDLYNFDVSLSDASGAQYVEDADHMQRLVTQNTGNNLCVYFYLNEEGTRRYAADAKHHNQQSMQSLVDVFKAKFLTLTLDDRKDFIQSRLSALQKSQDGGHHYVGAVIAASWLPKTGHNYQRIVGILHGLAEMYDVKSNVTERMKIDTVIKNYIDSLSDEAKSPRIIEIYRVTTARIESSTQSLGTMTMNGGLA